MCTWLFELMSQSCQLEPVWLVSYPLSFKQGIFTHYKESRSDWMYMQMCSLEWAKLSARLKYMDRKQTQRTVSWTQQRLCNDWKGVWGYKGKCTLAGREYNEWTHATAKLGDWPVISTQATLSIEWAQIGDSHRTGANIFLICIF